MILEARVGGEAAVAPMNARVRVVHVEVIHALRAPEPARLEEERHLPVRDLVAVQPEVAHEDAMERSLVGGALVAAHPERARLDQHDAVGGGGARPERRGRCPCP
jgi:hypothetical protein